MAKYKENATWACLRQMKSASRYKLKRVMMPLKHSDFSVLMASFDTSARHDEIIMDKILPELRKWTEKGASQA